MAVLLPNGKQYFTTNGGLPLVGGKLYTYAAGTLIPKLTFSDAAATVPNSNPVFLDARGEAIIFWEGAYKVELRDSVDNVIWTIDNVFANTASQVTIDAVLDELANDTDITKGDALVAVRQPVTLGKARTQHDKNYEVVTILDIEGADPTGIASSSTAVSGAIEALRIKGAIVQNGVAQGTKSIRLRFPPGTYKLVETVLVPPCIEFDGDGCTILCPDDKPAFESAYYASGVLTSNWALPDVDVPSFGLIGTRFRNITFWGGALPLKLRCAVWQSGIFDCQFYNCQVAYQLRQCFYFKLEGITIRGDHATLPHDYGMKFERASNAIEMNNYSVSYREKLIRLGEAGDVQASATVAFTNGRLEVATLGIEVVGTVRGLTIKDTYVEEVSTCFFDTDGALKYNVRIEQTYSNSTAWCVDFSGLRDSFIGRFQDFSGTPTTKGIVRLRPGTFGNQADVELSNVDDPLPNLNLRYDLSSGVRTFGSFSKYTSGAQAVIRSRDELRADDTNIFVQIPIHDRGTYGAAVGYVIGAATGIVNNTAGTEVAILTDMRFSEYNMIGFGVKITPNAGSGAGGTTPAPIILQGYFVGARCHCLTPTFGGYADQNGPGMTVLHFTGFGANNVDPAFAWMRNNLFVSEGIVKLVA